MKSFRVKEGLRLGQDFTHLSSDARNMQADSSSVNSHEEILFIVTVTK